MSPGQATPKPSGTRVMVSGNDREMGGTMTVFTSMSVSTTWCCVDNVSRIFLCLCVHRAQLTQLVICRLLRFHRRRHTVVSTCCFTELVRVGVKIPQDGNRANVYEHVAVVHEHVWRTLCSVCATGARVARPVPCNS